MKLKSIIALAVFLLLSTYSFCQDVITTTDGTDIQGRVVKITNKAVKYRLLIGEDTSIVKSISKYEVFRIVYENGLKEVFNETHVDDSDKEGHWDKRSLMQQGREDAEQYYDGYKQGKWWTYGATVFSGGVLGLIPAIAISSTPPKDKNLNCPNDDLLRNHEYKKAYKYAAKRIKSRKVWGGYGLGIATLAIVFGFVIII